MSEDWLELESVVRCPPIVEFNKLAALMFGTKEQTISLRGGNDLKYTHRI